LALRLRGLRAVRIGVVVVRAIRMQVPTHAAKPAVREIPTRDRFRCSRVDVPGRRRTRPLLLTIRLTIRLSLKLARRLGVSGLAILLRLTGLRITSRWEWVGHHTSMLWYLRRHNSILRGRRGHPIRRRRVRHKTCWWRGVPDAIRPHEAWHLLRLSRGALGWLAVW
jgi:hypothetical protein